MDGLSYCLITTYENLKCNTTSKKAKKEKNQYLPWQDGVWEGVGGFRDAIALVNPIITWIHHLDRARCTGRRGRRRWTWARCAPPETRSAHSWGMAFYFTCVAYLSVTFSLPLTTHSLTDWLALLLTYSLTNSLTLPSGYMQSESYSMPRFELWKCKLNRIKD